MDKQAEIERIKQKYAERNKEIERQHRKEMARIIGGGVLQGASALPIFNIPYVGTGLGGALFEAGNAIMQGKNAKDIAKDAGKGFVIGETVGAIPYAGKFAGKTKAGQAVANQASNFANRLAETKIGQKVAEIAPKVEDVLMTDIKAFNPFKQTQTAYHGSPYDFAKFSNEAIGTGEGAQAHGMGHYAAKSKDVADQRYRKGLVDNKYENVELNGQEIEKMPFGGYQYKNSGEKAAEGNGLVIDMALNRLAKNGNNVDSAIEYVSKELDISNPWKDDVIDFLKNNNIKVTPKTGQLYKLSIPKDDVMLREGATLAEQPKLLNRLGMNNTENVKQEMTNLLDYIKNNKSSLPSEELNNLRKQYSDLSYKKMLNDPQLKSEAYYNALTDSLGSEQLANEFLLDKGIKGISYNGGIDGEARVIFNPDDIDIVRKYYNQPTFNELINKNTNMGAFMNALMQD